MMQRNKIKLYGKLSILFAVLIVITSCKKNVPEDSKIKNENITVPVAKEVSKDSIIYSKILSLNNISFEIKASRNLVTIQPKGYTIDNSIITKPIEGTITNTEIGDLNSDGFPEIMIYITSDGSGSYGSLIGFSSNKNKSMSEIAFPSFIDNPKINKGYMGHDEFAIIETNVSQRFPIYNDSDTNSNPTGKTRQIQYKLKDGETSRKLVVDKIIEY